MNHWNHSALGTALRSLWAIAMLVGFFIANPATQAAQQTPEQAAAREARLKWWREARFGMFIHWGPVSIKGTEIGWSRGAQIPIAEYDNLYKQFNPTQFNADEWVKLAADAGMKYMVFTTKHHDGFCMWDTKQTDFNITKSPFGRDVVKELSAACKKQDFAFGTYHSVCDWHHPDFPLGSPGGRSRKPEPNLERYNEYLKNQVKELITNYGPLSTMWFDVPQEFDQKRGLALEEFTRALQPDILINNRSGAKGDYETPEQHVGDFRIDRPWETCMTICHQWAWKPNDTMKSLKQCIQTLVMCAGGDGNLLFNVGPMPDGRIEQRQIDRLREMGQWLKANGQSIYATRGGPYKPTRALASTRRDQTVFIHVLEWPEEQITLPALPKKIVKAELLSGREVKVAQTAEGVTISVAPADRDEIDTVVKLTLDGAAMEIAPMRLSAPSLTTGKPAKASNIFLKQPAYGPDKAVDDNTESRWATDAGTKQAWIEVDLGVEQTIARASIQEYESRVNGFELQAQRDGQWETFAKGQKIGRGLDIKFEPVKAKVVRLNILDASNGPSIWEFNLYPPAKK